MKNTSFIFYGSFHEAMSELNNAQYGALMRAINDYALNGVVPELKGMLKMAFILIKPQLDANLERRENGKGGGRSSITDDVKNDIIQDLQNGATQKDIAEKYNVAQSTVSNIKNEISLEISEISPEISQISLSKTSVYDITEYQKPNVNDNDNDIPPECRPCNRPMQITGLTHRQAAQIPQTAERLRKIISLLLLHKAA